MMKLLYSKPSAYSRKVRLAAAAIGITDDIFLVATDPKANRAALQEDNPLGKIPVLLVDGMSIFDSVVICRYLDDRFGPGIVVPATPADRLAASRIEALGDGIIEAGMLLRAEFLRPEAGRDAAIEATQRGKVDASLAYLEAEIDHLAGGWSVGQMAVVSALGWLEFRLGDQNFLDSRPRLRGWYEEMLRRPDVEATRPDA